MLSENKFSKYLLYAIGEIFLVVVGILIALQINNSNNKRIENVREIGYLKNIKLDLKKDIEAFKNSKSKSLRLLELIDLELQN